MSACPLCQEGRGTVSTPNERAAFLLTAIPQQHQQREDGVNDQLWMMHLAATRLGLHDAARWLWERAFPQTGVR